MKINMKATVFVFLASLLVAAILAPSLITLSKVGEKTAFIIDFNEEEKKEEKKESNEKEFFLDYDLFAFFHLQSSKTTISSFNVESEYTTSLAIFLPPPENAL